MWKSKLKIRKSRIPGIIQGEYLAPNQTRVQGVDSHPYQAARARPNLKRKLGPSHQTIRHVRLNSKYPLAPIMERHARLQIIRLPKSALLVVGTRETNTQANVTATTLVLTDLPALRRKRSFINRQHRISVLLVSSN